MKNVFLTVTIFSFFGILNVFGQFNNDPKPAATESERVSNERQANQVRIEQQRIENNQNNAAEKLRMDNEAVKRIFIPKNVDAKAEKEIAKRVEESKKIVTASKPLRKKYQEFLRNKQSNIAIIFPDLNCEILDVGKVIDVKEAERCANTIQLQKNGSLYSFKSAKNYFDVYEMDNERFNPQGWWDLHFIGNEFVVGNCCTQGVIADLGNIDIENLDSISPNLKYLYNFEPSTTVEEVQRKNQLLYKGLNFDNVLYKKIVPTKVGHYYALRSVSYDIRREKKTTGKILKILSDSIILFKVAEVRQDGSLILLWINLRKNRLKKS